MRVISWNLARLADPAAARAVLRDLEPDAVLLQEAGAPGATRDLARALGMTAVTAPTPVLRRRIANAILVRPTVEPGAARSLRFGGSRLREPRGALVLDATIGGAPIRLISSHLGLHPRERVRHARILARLFDRTSVLGVDLNAEPSSVAGRTLIGVGVDALDRSPEPRTTFPAGTPTAAIDVLVVGRAWTVARAWVVGGDRADVLASITRASDHRPVAAELLLDSAA